MLVFDIADATFGVFERICVDSEGRLVIACTRGIYRLCPGDWLEKIGSYDGIKTIFWMDCLLGMPNSDVYFSDSCGLKVLHDGAMRTIPLADVACDSKGLWVLGTTLDRVNLIAMDDGSSLVYEFTKDGRYVSTVEWSALEQFSTADADTFYRYGSLVFVEGPDSIFPDMLHGGGISMDTLRERVKPGEEIWDMPIHSSTVFEGDTYHIGNQDAVLYRNFEPFMDFSSGDLDCPRFVASNRECLYIMFHRHMRGVWINPRWSPDMHHRFGREARQSIKVVMLLRYVGRSLLCVLPPELLSGLFTWLA